MYNLTVWNQLLVVDKITLLNPNQCLEWGKIDDFGFDWKVRRRVRALFLGEMLWPVID